MTDADTTLSDLSALVTAFRDAREWKQFHSPRNLAMAISVEANELLEQFLWHTDDHYYLAHDVVEKIAPEIADVIIYVLSLVDVLDLDVSEIVRDKVKRNGTRYPVEQVRGRADKAGV